jgi:hypothetical protein
VSASTAAVATPLHDGCTLDVAAAVADVCCSVTSCCTRHTSAGSSAASVAAAAPSHGVGRAVTIAADTDTGIAIVGVGVMDYNAPHGDGSDELRSL